MEKSSPARLVMSMYFIHCFFTQANLAGEQPGAGVAVDVAS